jgi:hypothetical protein
MIAAATATTATADVPLIAVDNGMAEMPPSP